MLIVFGGLPGTGKTTISRVLATRRGATYLRIDAIEQAIRNAGVLAGDVGLSGYGVANVLAQANLGGGRTVVADCVNPVRESRMAWRATAERVSSRLVEIEVVCSDPVEHRRRVETRRSDIPGLLPPTWRSITSHRFEPWPEPHFVIDTAHLTPEEAVAAIEAHIAEANTQSG